MPPSPGHREEDLHRSFALLTHGDIYIEDTLEPACPGHGGALLSQVLFYLAGLLPLTASGLALFTMYHYRHR